MDNLLAVFAAGASLVQVAHPDPGRRPGASQTENITAGLLTVTNPPQRLSCSSARDITTRWIWLVPS